ncbi:bifunctional 2-dehydro-3-deoxygluconokinase/2-dehydro-3-deoxygalactonokinase [Halorubellus sp. PRR65]|uniref:bifunctional 2-dehydro-3-deoxygluconokinase/2-dehydro-3- deoxygalactonokinase n=1 Tax=Halorubellus sp. PRR65 TaxID=3098148 RepID=UPI002B25BA34|nr:bifunctional 2-dehydro-3-deoxygluconokinase/2-dehydro-3-deoxygalactonokinase [Halorubellus sp. PRR65]
MSDDLVTFGETMLRLSPPNDERLETAREFEVRAAGAESNTAIAAERLGAVTTWMSKLPDTALGHRVDGGLRQYGVNTDVVWTDDDDVRQGTYYLESGGRPRGSNVVYDREDAAVTTATPDELDVDRIRQAQAFYTTGITPALSPQLRETAATLLDAAQQAGTMTAFDVNYRSKLWSPEEARKTITQFFQVVDVLIIALKDAKAVLNYEGDATQLAHHLASEFDFKTVVVTRGDQGALAWNDNVIHEQPAFETDTVDAVGTGDAFAGAFLARRLSGANVPKALEYAAAAAALKRTIPGDVATVTKAEVDAVVGEGGEAISR